MDQNTKRSFDWMFFLAIGLVLLAFLDTFAKLIPGDLPYLSPAIITIGSFVINVAAARFDSRKNPAISGRYNTLFIGMIGAITLHILHNIFIYTILSTMIVVAQTMINEKRLSIDNIEQLEYYIKICSGAIGSILACLLSIFIGLTIVFRARQRFWAMLIATTGFVVLGLLLRAIAAFRGNLGQFDIFADAGWFNVAQGVIINWAIVSIMIWLGVLLRRTPLQQSPSG